MSASSSDPVGPGGGARSTVPRLDTVEDDLVQPLGTQVEMLFSRCALGYSSSDIAASRDDLYDHASRAKDALVAYDSQTPNQAGDAQSAALWNRLAQALERLILTVGGKTVDGAPPHPAVLQVLTVSGAAVLKAEDNERVRQRGVVPQGAEAADLVVPLIIALGAMRVSGPAAAGPITPSPVPPSSSSTSSSAPPPA